MNLQQSNGVERNNRYLCRRDLFSLAEHNLRAERCPSQFPTLCCARTHLFVHFVDALAPGGTEMASSWGGFLNLQYQCKPDIRLNNLYETVRCPRRLSLSQLSTSKMAWTTKQHNRTFSRNLPNMPIFEGQEICALCQGLDVSRKQSDYDVERKCTHRSRQGHTAVRSSLYESDVNCDS